jgi:hypothetical protein
MSRPRKPPKEQPSEIQVEHWKNYISSAQYNRGVLSVKPIPAMVSATGYTKLITGDRGEAPKMIAYDTEYVFNYYHKDLLLRMGLVDDKGDADEDAVYAFCSELIEYTKKEKLHAEKQVILDKAKKMATEYTHLTEEQWIEILSKP